METEQQAFFTHASSRLALGENASNTLARARERERTDFARVRRSESFAPGLIQLLLAKILNFTAVMVVKPMIRMTFKVPAVSFVVASVGLIKQQRNMGLCQLKY